MPQIFSLTPALSKGEGVDNEFVFEVFCNIFDFIALLN
jgi:hypothetical protein